MERKKLSNKERLRLFELHNGFCYLCGGKIDGTREAWEIEHLVPVALGGEETDDNRKPVHAGCHKPKTATDVRKVRKADRVKRKHTGAQRSRSPLPAGKKSKWKKKIDGTVVRRD